MLVCLCAPTGISPLRIGDDRLYEEVGLQSCQSVSAEACPVNNTFNFPLTKLLSADHSAQPFKIFPLPLRYLTFPCCLLYSSVPYNDVYSYPPQGYQFLIAFLTPPFW